MGGAGGRGGAWLGGGGCFRLQPRVGPGRDGTIKSEGRWGMEAHTPAFQSLNHLCRTLGGSYCPTGPVNREVGCNLHFPTAWDPQSCRRTPRTALGTPELPQDPQSAAGPLKCRGTPRTAVGVMPFSLCLLFYSVLPLPHFPKNKTGTCSLWTWFVTVES